MDTVLFCFVSDSILRQGIIWDDYSSLDRNLILKKLIKTGTISKG